MKNLFISLRYPSTGKGLLHHRICHLNINEFFFSLRMHLVNASVKIEINVIMNHSSTAGNRIIDLNDLHHWNNCANQFFSNIIQSHIVQ